MKRDHPFYLVAHFLFHFYEIAFPALAIPLMLSLKMDLKGVLELGFPMYLLFGLSSLPWDILLIASAIAGP